MAYERLYKKYLPVVVDYFVSLNAHKALVKDLSQEVFTRLWQHRARYRPESSFKTYLFGCAKNVLSEKLKQSAKDKAISKRLFLQYHNTNSDSSGNPELKVFQEKSIKNARRAISKLPSNQKKAIELYYITEASISECAKRAKCSVQAFEGRLFRARQSLCRLLETYKS